MSSESLIPRVGQRFWDKEGHYYTCVGYSLALERVYAVSVPAYAGLTVESVSMDNVVQLQANETDILRRLVD